MLDSIEVYKKIPIYRDDTSDDIFIYRHKGGRGRINFPTLKECKKYIDNNLDDIKCSRNVILKSIHWSWSNKEKEQMLL